MSRTISSAQHEALRLYIIEKRQKANLRQIDVAKRMKRFQSFVSAVEVGQRRVNVVDLMSFADAIGFDPCEALRRLKSK